jgi:nitroimidazol reductase NimA-like FMN-containing flavoprotein (pyridoxamine 5'-phosphate oxidase superfamily)
MTGIADADVDRNGLEILGRAECFRLLATATLGRVGITCGALPTVLPVNFRLVGDRIVFRTGVGTKLAAGTRNAIIAFEVDDIDPFSHTGWSVVVTGEAGEVTEPDELAELAYANIPRWAPSDDDRVVAVSTPMMSGRRIVPGLRAPDHR